MQAPDLSRDLDKLALGKSLCDHYGNFNMTEVLDATETYGQGKRKIMKRKQTACNIMILF